MWLAARPETFTCKFHILVMLILIITLRILFDLPSSSGWVFYFKGFRMNRVSGSVFTGWAIWVPFSVGTEIFLFVIYALTFPGGPLDLSLSRGRRLKLTTHLSICAPCRDATILQLCQNSPNILTGYEVKC